MKFGKVLNPEDLDLTLPADHIDTLKVLNQNSKTASFEMLVGCAKWNKTDLKNFYPRGTKDELTYYASQFNSIELNATFYRLFPFQQFEKWKEKTPDNFKFYPKVPQDISHFKRLKGAEAVVEMYAEAVSGLGHKLGRVFLQMPENFSTTKMPEVIRFIENWPKEIPLAMELRHTDWYNNEVIANELYSLFEDYQVANVITDTAGRRDLLHMRLTSPIAFVRYVGANHKSDYPRLDEWVNRLAEWKSIGLQEANFFVHQNMELESPLLAQYFIQKLNKEIGSNLKVPKTLLDDTQGDLFS